MNRSDRSNPSTPLTPLTKVEKVESLQGEDGSKIEAFVLSNQNRISAKLSTYGASLVGLQLPDRQGNLADVVLGFDLLEQYQGVHPYFGSTIGRYANRIAQGKFNLDGKEYQLARNNYPHSLHGGDVGFDRRLWNVEPVQSEALVGVSFSYVSKDGEEHFPGTLAVRVKYTLSAQNELTLEYSAETDKPTPINLTHHSYFNLAGGGDVLGHTLFLNADEYTPVDSSLIPTGEMSSVEHTAFDFRTPRQIGFHIGELEAVGGYDHNFVIKGKPDNLRLAARLSEPDSGREFEMWTTEPAVQFYTGGQLNGSVIGKGGVHYQKYSGVCLETQHYPDLPNRPSFPSTILRPGQTFHSTTVYKFSGH